jgi:hypothetical protein
MLMKTSKLPRTDFIEHAILGSGWSSLFFASTPQSRHLEHRKRYEQTRQLIENKTPVLDNPSIY